MNRVATIGLLASVLFVTGLAGCTTEVNTPPSQTVIREDHDRSPDRVNVHVHDDTAKPDVQNNIKVDR
jgi:hypothetical protein